MLLRGSCTHTKIHCCTAVWIVAKLFFGVSEKMLKALLQNTFLEPSKHIYSVALFANNVNTVNSEVLGRVCLSRGPFVCFSISHDMQNTYLWERKPLTDIN